MNGKKIEQVPILLPRAFKNIPDVKTRNKKQETKFFSIAKLDNYKGAAFDISKKILGPVHLLPKTDKWDYLRSPI